MVVIKKISTSELLQHLERTDLKLLDVRTVDAYNGWTFNNEPRGGHIKGAKSLPAKWLRYIDWIEIVRHKNILPENKIIIYSDNEQDAVSVAERFLNSGYTNVLIYSDFLKKWVENPEMPMQKLERFSHLVSAGWVKQLLSNEKPLFYNNDKYVVVHAHYRNREAYLSGHIPGAIDINTNELESEETWNRRSPQELKKVLEKHGITPDTTVVMYGKYMFPKNEDPFPGSAAGDIGAIRCAFIMMYAGVKDVRVLNGGFQSWLDAGFETSKIDEPKRTAKNFGAEIPANPELAVDTPQAKKMLESLDAELVSVRSWPEWIGDVSGYNYIEKKGRIPGAVFADCGSDAYHMENYRNVDHTTREYHEIAETWIKNGITPDKHLAFYCGTGWRGSEAWFNAWLMGWLRVSVYDGGWFEWSNDPNNPHETGVPEEYKVVAE